MVDPLDEYITQQVKDYKDKNLICITKENSNLGTTDKTELDNLKNDFSVLCNYFKSVLNDDVEKVIISDRLGEFPCLLSTSEFGWTANMQRLVKAQTFGKQDMMQFMMGKKILEINPKHEIIIKLRKRIDDNVDESELVKLLYDISLQTSGFNLENSSGFLNRVLRYVNDSL
jgi:molecular chaperone HtpG